MSFPTNDGGLSIAAVVKWLLMIFGGVFVYQAYQGIVLKEGATGSIRNVGNPLHGSEAVKWGLGNLGYAFLLFAGAWAVWFFWQRNED
jgi:hypothetical protein